MTKDKWEITLNNNFEFWRIKEFSGGIIVYVKSPLYIHKFTDLAIQIPAGLLVEIKTIPKMFWVLLENKKWKRQMHKGLV